MDQMQFAPDDRFLICKRTNYIDLLFQQNENGPKCSLHQMTISPSSRILQHNVNRQILQSAPHRFKMLHSLITHLNAHQFEMHCKDLKCNTIWRIWGSRQLVLK